MANYEATCRTNYFRVTDEEKYRKLEENLCGEDVKTWISEIDGVIYHAFGTYGSLDYRVTDEEGEIVDYNFDEFLNKLMVLLPDDEAFVLFEAGNEKLRYVTGFVTVMTNKEIRYMNLSQWALATAREMLENQEFDTRMDY